MLQRLTREPALVVGVVTALFGVLVVFGVDLSNEQTGAIVVFVGAVMGLVRFLTTPAREVVAQVKPNGDVVAGAATTIPTGELVPVSVGEPSVVLPLPLDPPS